MKLKYTPDEDPKGKQNVFFACHPDDFDLYFDQIRRDILDYQDVAIWFKEDPNEAFKSKQEMREVLYERMNLIVVPVTTKLLIRSNQAMDVEIPFAEEYRIPVLPLMMEEGLDEVYARRFHEMQYLQPKQNDSTAIPYKEKLIRYLEGVLIGEEMIQKVRDAFDAYVFLSYRKIDRRHALELMHMIHHVPGYQDIAIWYDEYLVPGDSFRDAIKEALNKSDLFTMIVTPNLIIEKNYIQTDEYPMAKKEAQPYPILPVEMEETDRVELEKQFDQIPKTIPGKEGIVFTNAFLSSLERIATRGNDGSHEHNFFIGLAYLNGIDVEKDPEIAVPLIEGAAEAGVLEAMSQMAKIYHDGNGVKRDYYKSVEWRERIVAKLRENDSKDDIYGGSWQLKKENGHVLVEDHRNKHEKKCLYDELWQLGDDYLAMGEFKRAKHIFQEIMTMANDLPKVFVSKSIIPENMRDATIIPQDLPIIYERLGSIEEANGDPAEAEKWYRKALSINSSFERMNGRLEMKQRLSVTYDCLGNVAKARGRLKEAERCYKKAQEYCKVVAKKCNTSATVKELVISYYRLGDVARANWECEKAEKWYKKGHEISKTQLHDNATMDKKQLVAGGYLNKGHTALLMKRYKEAERCYQNSRKLFEDIVKETETLDAKRNMCTALLCLGKVVGITQGTRDAERYYQTGIDICKKIVEESEMIAAKHLLSLFYQSLGYVAHKEGDYILAEERYLDARNECKSLLDETKSPDILQTLSEIYEGLGNISIDNDDWNNAEKWYRKGLKISERLAKECETAKVHYLLAILYMHLGEIEDNREDEDKDEAERYYTKALKVSKKICQTNNSPNARILLSDIYKLLGGIAEDKNDYKNAENWYLKERNERLTLTNGNDMLEIKKDLADNCYRLGKTAKELYEQNNAEKRHLKDAQNWYLEELTIKESLCNENEKLKLITDRDLASNYCRLGDVAEKLGRPKEAKKRFSKSKEISERMLKEKDTLSTRWDLAIDCARLGCVAETVAEAEQLFQKALENIEIVVSTTEKPEVVQFQKIINEQLESISKEKKEADK